MKSQQIRIIGGIWRSRRIPILEEAGLRPSSDRNRETLFNWLAPYLPGSRCLDLFSGSGALAFESLSRGANHVTAIEISKKISRQIKVSASLLKADDLNSATFQLLTVDALKWLEKIETSPTNTINKPFDICFVDPPFRKSILNKVIEQLERTTLLSGNAILYLEHEKGLTPSLSPSWIKLKHKYAGQVVYALYQRLPIPND